MPSNAMLYLVLGSHGLLLLLAMIYGCLSVRHLEPAYYLWMSLVPVFGPLAGMAFSRAIGKVPVLMEAQHHTHKPKDTPRHQMPVNEVVPLEEALLIDDPHTRRTLMMHVLRDDPMQYLDLLLVARFNEDTETAHYATATLMELQRKFQTEIHRKLAELAQGEENIDKLRAYTLYLSAYCDSGLLEGQLLRRQRLALKKALEDCLRLVEDPTLLHIMVRNDLALGDAGGARDVAQKLMERWPRDEQSWLAGMRVYAETHDQSAMRALFEKMRETPVDLTIKGREQMLFWKERNA